MSAARETAPLPNWPALLNTTLAAAYVGLGEQSFRALAAYHRLRPADMTPIRAVRYRREDLDRLIDRLGGEAPHLAPDEAPPLDPAETRRQAALDRAARRVRR